MVSFLTNALLVSCLTSLVSLVLIGIFHVGKGKISPKIQYWTWVILFLALLLPFRPRLGRGLIALPDLGSPASSTPQELGQLVTQAPAAPSGFLAELPWFLIVTVIWLSGVAFYLVRHVRSYLRFRRLVKRWGQEIEDLEILEHFFAIKEEMGISEEIALIHYPLGHSPMMTGFRRRTILLPETNYTAEELDLIFEHELTHYHHKDLYVNLLGLVVTSLHWFNPLIRLAYREIQEAGEIYCDYDVLRQRDTAYRAFYGETIITMIDQNQKSPLALTTCFYSNRFNLKRRITAIMNTALPKNFLSVALVGLLSLLLLLSGSILAVTTGSSPKTESHTPVKQTNRLTEEEAIQQAMTQAGVTAEQVKQTTIRLDKGIYQISLATTNDRYECRLDSQTGRLLSLEKTKNELKKEEKPSPPAPSTSPSQKAKETRSETVGGEVVQQSQTPPQTQPSVQAPPSTTPSSQERAPRPTPTPAPVAPQPSPARTTGSDDDEDNDEEDGEEDSDDDD